MRTLNRYEQWYIETGNRILKEGQFRGDRTGTGVYSLPFINYTHDLRVNHPLMSTREFVYHQPITEMIWMMSGESNIEYLVKNGCPFWNCFATQGDEVVTEILDRAERIRLYAEKRGASYAEAITMFMHESFSTVDALLDKEEIPNRVDIKPHAGELGPVYGVQWRNWPNPDGTTFDQLQYAHDQLACNPNNRRIVVDCWNPSYLPDPKKAPRENAAEGKMALTPCHFAFGFYTEAIPYHERAELLIKVLGDEGRKYYPIQSDKKTVKHLEDLFMEYEIPEYYLDVNFVMRSNDWVLGQPANMNMYSALCMMYANELNMVPRFVNYTGWDCHIYSNHLEGWKEINRRWDTGDFKYTDHKVTLDSSPLGLFNYHKSDFSCTGYAPAPKIKFPIAI